MGLGGATPRPDISHRRECDNGGMSENHQTLEATVRRVPRYGVFMVLGAVLGVIVAGILSMTGSDGESVVGVSYTPGQVFGFLLLYAVPIGVALGALFAMLLERMQRRHDRVVQVDRETVAETD